jgi:hypothetical protein
MTRKIINYKDQLIMNTFWTGKDEGVSIHISTNNERAFIQFESREKVIILFKKVIAKLEAQKKKDKLSPPFWQEISKKVKK